MEMKKKITAKNPIIDSDFPDPDIIRVGNTYYMAVQRCILCRVV